MSYSLRAQMAAIRVPKAAYGHLARASADKRAEGFRLALLRQSRRMPERAPVMCCQRCGQMIPARRITRKYCSNRCRQAAYLHRRYPPPLAQGPWTPADIEALLWRPTLPVRD